MSRQAHPAARKLGPLAEEGPGLRVLHSEDDGGRPASNANLDLDATAILQELAQLRTENAELRGHLQQNEEVLHAAIASEEAWLERQRENEALLEEKSDVIRGLHQRIQELQDGSAGQNLLKAQELNQQQADLEELRQQLELDKQDLLTQMRTMELELSRDRADIARQRNELQRQRSEIEREVEAAARDPQLKERLASLSRRHQESASVRGGPPPAAASAPTATSTSAPAKGNSGLLKRFFGGGQ